MDISNSGGNKYEGSGSGGSGGGGEGWWLRSLFGHVLKENKYVLI